LGNFAYHSAVDNIEKGDNAHRSFIQPV